MQQASALGFRYVCPRWASGLAANRRPACFRVGKLLEGVVHDNRGGWKAGTLYAVLGSVKRLYNVVVEQQNQHR